MTDQTITFHCPKCEINYSLIDCKLIPTDREDVSILVCPNGSHVLGEQKITKHGGFMTLSYALITPSWIDSRHQMPLTV